MSNSTRLARDLVMFRAVPGIFCVLVSLAPGWEAPGATAQRREPAVPAADGGAARARPFDLTNTPHPAVVRVVVAEKHGTSYGSGTLVDVRDKFGLIVTNWHVVKDAAGRIDVVFPDGQRSASRALRVDPNWDLAALVIWRPRVAPVRIARTAPRAGDRLTIAGYGQGQYRACTGRCTQYVAPGRRFPFEMLEVNVAARQGDSGGPIFNEAGELAGVLFGSGNGNTVGSFCGRVGGFLATLAPDIGTGPAVVEDQPSKPVPNDEPIAVATRLSPNPPPRQSAPSATRPDPEPSAPAAAALRGPSPSHKTSFSWSDLTGRSIFEQIKNGLALLGFLAILFAVARLA